MREIKFRAYIRSLQWMVQVERICFDIGTIEVDLTDGNGDTSEYYFDEIELMQYTGLKDKNGVEIYEGDIVKTDNGSYLYVIAYHHAWYDPLHIIKNECLQVIGNIYEHPERLKESKE